MKSIVLKFRLNSSRPLFDLIKEPHYVVDDATLPIRVLASRFVRGELAGINVHEAQYSTELSPIVSKGVDLCDFSSIKSYYDNMSKTQKSKYDSLQRQLKDLADQLKRDDNSTKTPPPES